MENVGKYLSKGEILFYLGRKIISVVPRTSCQVTLNGVHLLKLGAVHSVAP